MQISDQIWEVPAMRIQGLERLTRAELECELAAGGRFVFFEYCISLVIVSLRRPSHVYFLRARESALVPGWPYTILSLLLGWWGVPWGIVYTVLTIYTNFSGGCDVTAEVRAILERPEGAMPPPGQLAAPLPT